MTWIIWTVIFSILFWVGIGTWLWAKGRNKDYAERLAASANTYEEKSLRESVAVSGFVSKVALGSAIGIVVLWAGISLLLMLHTVGQREVAIIYNFSGTIAGKKDPGVVTTFPWQHVKKENVGIQHAEYLFTAENSAVSKDQQEIFGNLAVNFQIDTENVVDLYERVGPSWKTIIIDSRVPQVFKEVTSTFQTPRITEERVALRENTKDRLTEELAPYDIKVVDVFITNLGFSAGYTASIEAKQEQVQRALEAEAKVGQIEAEARQKVAEANGEAKANIARAKGDSVANRLRQRSLTPLLVRQLAIEKLNPNVQVIICPPQSVCIPNSGIIPNPASP